MAEIEFGKLLVALFQAAQTFDMSIQPQLVLLQKTLLNIEGIGRQLWRARPVGNSETVSRSMDG